MLSVQFFGSDIFSIKSLEAVLRLSKTHKDLVDRVQVVTRLQKPSGRGQSTITDLPIVTYAKQHNLDWIEAETQQDFINLLNQRPNLAIAVSYGKLIPEQYLTSLRYGGLNVHPSLLPTFRGAAPLHRAILQRVPYTGVSVQTLDPHKFDRGKILWQSDQIPLSPATTVDQLRLQLADIGSYGLETVLSDKLFLQDGMESSYPPSWAKVISKEEHRLNCSSTVAEALAQANALSKLFFEQPLKKKKESRTRTLISDITPLGPSEDETGTIKLIDGKLGIKLSDGYIGAAKVQAAGYKAETAEEYYAKLSKRGLILNIILG